MQDRGKSWTVKCDGDSVTLKLSSQTISSHPSGGLMTKFWTIAARNR